MRRNLKFHGFSLEKMASAARMILLTVLLVSRFYGSAGAAAEKFTSFTNRFSISPPAGWERIPPRHQGVLVSFALSGSEAFMTVVVRPVEGDAAVDNLSWEQLFQPHSDEIEVQNDGMTTVGGVPAKYCVYAFREGPFKEQVEGARSRMYLNYVIVRGGQLYSVTFVDQESDFAFHHSSFLDLIQAWIFLD